MRALEPIRIFLFLAATRWLMKLRLERVGALISRPVQQGAPDQQRIARTVRTVDLILRFGRPFVASGCISRGLALYYFLRQLGVNVALVFGAGQVDHQFAAHCWLERDNQPYLEKVNPRDFFAAVYRFGDMR